MLPLVNRLIKNSDFKKVLQDGIVVASGPVFLRFKKNNLKYSRFGFCVGIKFSKKAVERNLVKRKIREIIRRELSCLKSGFDVIIIPRKLVDKKLVNWDIYLKKALKKADLLKKIKE